MIVAIWATAGIAAGFAIAGVVGWILGRTGRRPDGMGD